MEAAVASALTKEVALKLVSLLGEKHRLSKGLKDDLRFIRTELDMISSSRDSHNPSSSRPPQAAVSMDEMRDLAHDIEDCIDRFLPCVACEGEASTVLHRMKKAVTSTRSRFAAEIHKLRRRLKDAHERRVNYDVRGGGSSSSAAAGAASSSPATAADAAESDPVGIEGPKKELVELLLGSEPGKLSTLSIVGFGGSGKTTLARAVYDCPGVVQSFPCRAWAVASEHRDPEGLLTAILRQFTADVPPVRSSIKEFLRTTRCLIVIDDINKQYWDAIKSIFTKETESRIIVTTALQSVANACSSGDGYVYKMSILNAEHSKVLLNKKVFFRGCSPELERGSTAIVEKCDGLPLALVSVAKFLLGENELTGSHCAQVCRSLGYHMEKESDFRKLQQVLVNNYSSLSGYPLRTSLLYMSVFPNGRPIRKKTLVRRWLAEGYVQCQYKRSDLEMADENFQELVDRNIIRPIDASNNAKVKTCKTHGIMHEFILHKSMADNFITSLHDQNRSNFRHLFIQNPANGNALGLNQHTSSASGEASSSEKFRARSLTIFGNVGEAASEFCRCELLRVLDLEECNDLEDDHLKDIHKLWHLKYLSLGGAIRNLPRKIDKLHCLETLDLRKTKIEILPVEVIGLPHLAHLLGKFKLGKNDLKMSELEKFLPKKSKLKTLAGFVADENPGFLQLMDHMTELKKVKIWCESTGAADNKCLPHISKAVQKFAQDGMDTTGVRSLSLDFGNSLGDFLGSIQEYCYLSSLKLRGGLSLLPQFVTSLCGLTELCLVSTNLMGNDLSNLCKLRYLLYLKLVEAELGNFIIKNGDFPSLRRLCLVVQIPVLPTINKGGLPYLVSLQLLCEDLVDLSGINIEYHDCLQEVALDSMVSIKTAELWETAAKKHPKRPKVLFLKRIDPSETQSTVKYVATDGPTLKKDSSIEFSQVQLSQNMSQKKCIIQSGPVNQLNSTLKQIIVSETELSSVGKGVMPHSASIC